MLSRCLATTFCVSETSEVTECQYTTTSTTSTSTTLPSSEYHHQQHQQHQQQQLSNNNSNNHTKNMSSNQHQVLLAGEYAERRLLSRKSPLAAFTSQLEEKKSFTLLIQSREEFEQHQGQNEELRQLEEEEADERGGEEGEGLKKKKKQLEWPEKEGIDGSIFLSIEPKCIQIGHEIGKGAFSVVYAGKYQGQDVAVKCQPKDAQDKIPDFVIREVQVLRLLRHSRLLKYIGAADNVRAKQVWILSEYLNNGDVDLLLKAIRSEKKRHVGWHRMVHIALDAAQGIEFLQMRHIAHRDIKSSNILLDDQYRAKLCDFGFAVKIKPVKAIANGAAELEASKQRCKSYCGTDAYMAPEMFLDEDYDQSVDIFSFGVVLMEMLCCRVANSDGFLMRLPQFKFQVSLAEFRAALPSSCPSALAAVAEQCVSFEPSERPKIKIIVQTLEDVLKHTSSSHRDVVELVHFTPDEREPQIDADDDACHGENDEDGYDDDEGDDEEEDDDKEIEEDQSRYNLQAHGRHNKMGMESDEEERSVRSQVVDNPFLYDGSVDNDVKALRSSPAPYHEGVILKRGRRGKRFWVEKWFIVDHDQLRYTDVPPLWQQHQQQNREWRCTLPPISSLSLRGCRIWKTMEMPELRFNVIDINWKIKRELQAVSKRDLELWIELISQAIDYANDIYSREHNMRNNSTTGTSANSSNASYPNRNKVSEMQPQSQAPSKPLDQRPKEKADVVGPRNNKRRSSATKFDEPPELPESKEDRADEVYVWLKQIGFQRYTPMLKAKGFDSLDFIRETGIEMEDLNFVGIKEPVARKSIRSAARALRGDDDDD